MAEVPTPADKTKAAKPANKPKPKAKATKAVTARKWTAFDRFLL